MTTVDEARTICCLTDALFHLESVAHSLWALGNVSGHPKLHTFTHWIELALIQRVDDRFPVQLSDPVEGMDQARARFGSAAVALQSVRDNPWARAHLLWWAHELVEWVSDALARDLADMPALPPRLNVFFTIQVARIAGVEREQLHDWQRQRLIQPGTFPSGMRQWSADDIDRAKRLAGR